MNNMVKQNHRAIKRRIDPMLGFKSFRSARKLLGSLDIMHASTRGSVTTSWCLLHRVLHSQNLHGAGLGQNAIKNDVVLMCNQLAHIVR